MKHAVLLTFTCWFSVTKEFYTSSVRSDPATCFGVNNCTIFNTSLRQVVLSVASISSAVDALMKSWVVKRKNLFLIKKKGSCLHWNKLFRPFSLLYSSFPLAWRLCSMNPPKKNNLLYFVFITYLCPFCLLGMSTCWLFNKAVWIFNKLVSTSFFLWGKRKGHT